MQRTIGTMTGTLALGLMLACGHAHAADVVGVAFVHGTGMQTDARADYWQPDIIDAVRQGLPDNSNHLVINCDFNQYMWSPDAAGCLATQLTTFINGKGITKLVLITHSNGGNVVRWILSNPTYDSRYPKIIQTVSKVTALAPSSAGTPLADLALNGNALESSLGWLLGYRSDAVRQQRVGDMATYNAHMLYGTAGRPALPRPFRAVVGTDVQSAVWDSDSYCGGYMQNVGLEFTQNWLDSCSDGFLECSSQMAAGTTWFSDTQRTRGRRSLSHNQSRRDCFGLGTILRNDLTQ